MLCAEVSPCGRRIATGGGSGGVISDHAISLWQQARVHTPRARHTAPPRVASLLPLCRPQPQSSLNPGGPDPRPQDQQDHTACIASSATDPPPAPSAVCLPVARPPAEQCGGR